MTERMQEIGARINAFASACALASNGDEYRDYMAAKDALYGNAVADLDYLHSRCASLEALARELAKGVVAVRDLMAESVGVYGLHLNGDPSPWEELTEGGRFEGWLIDYSAAESALSHPLVSELTGEKEEAE